MESSLFYIAPIGSVIALIFAWFFYKNMMKSDAGNAKMQEIAGHVKEGAMAYLYRQYKVVSLVFLVLLIIFTILAFFGVQNPFVPVAFLTGGFFSGLCGYLGMRTATNASSRTAQGASNSLNQGLKVAFRSGAVMGLVVVGLGLIDISIWYTALNYLYDNNVWGLSAALVRKIETATVFSMSLINTPEFQHAKLVEITTTMITFGMGASTQALFARVGGGIFTKAADVGADLVGKVEAGIPEDDPRNPATIADNVGDNVGDVAGMGADLYESYCGSILATAALGAALPLTSAGYGGLKAVIAPMIVAGLGILFSVIGIFAVRTKEDASMKNLLKSLNIGVWGSSFLILVALAIMAGVNFITWGIFGAVVAGLVAGLIIGQATEYYTSDEYKPTQGIAEQTKMGYATTIIEGIATGMYSTGIPVVTIVIGILVAFGVSGGFTNMAQGLYGIGFAAVGMLSTLGITLATDAYGPIADNAGGNAEMSGLDPEVRKRTDALDMLGNTTAATGKGFAIGSAALTAMALLSAYLEEIKLWLGKLAGKGFFQVGTVKFYNTLPEGVKEGPNVIVAHLAQIQDFARAYDLSLMNPKVLCGLFLGAMMAFVFSAMTMKAVGRAASAMIEEVRRQFKQLPGILTGKDKPDYAQCVSISTAGAQREMIVPSLLAIIVPVVTGLILGVAGVMGLLAGGLTAGFSLACMLNNSGGAWDNAKKFIEKGNFGGKGSESHKAGVVGDTVGDPFKDTSGPSLNILIKLMTMVSVVFAGVIVKFSPAIGKLLGF
ncbi:MAG: sodium-translocating pyrophosphatase [Spirochaetes bacterium]|nr:sodium-translocating pyrophosphatase [Spirochaetota bacterium]